MSQLLNGDPGVLSDSARGKLLVIDDEQEILKALRRQFHYDYDIFIANSAEEGYQVMTEVPIQVIISDQRMPGMTGSAFFERMKTEFPDAIRLLLTGYADIRAVIEAINDGNIYRYITKPWDAVELDTIVYEAFDRYRIIAQNRRLLIELQEANTLLEARVQQRTAELHEANAGLQRLNAQKDRFMGMAAHDLRSPIGVIRGYADFMLDERADANNNHEYVTIIRETAQNMLNLLNDLLDITAIASGHLTLDRQTVEVRPFTERIVRLSHLLAEQKGIALVMDLEDPLPPGYFDPQRIEQVLNNLLSNAIKYSHPGTRTTIRVGRADDQLVFAVIDQGQGIRPEEIGKLFGDFQRLSTRPTGDETSTGLGLSICKRIVELHDGQIGVESVWGQGSCFFFRLPLAESAPLTSLED